MDYLTKLAARSWQNRSPLGLRLDIPAAKMPLPFARTDDAMLPFAQALIDATRDLVAAYVIDPAYYFSEGAPGMIALERITRYVPDDIPIVLDTRFGPLGDSVVHAARGAFEAFRADAVTFSVPPDPRTLDAFLNYPGKLLFVPGVIITADGLGQLIETGNELRSMATGMPCLIRHAARPDKTVALTGPTVIESDSRLIYASRRDDFAEAMRAAVLAAL
ncbi:MAG: hypothetical protein HY870_24720 [Chloroflexi bacterium]|nr:hypothetical protein [Chloroflexota bacterium]